MRIIKINEQQYSSMILNEEMHYPKFLDNLKNFVSMKIHMEIEEQIRNNNFEFQYVLPCNCTYTDNILFDIKINPHIDIKNKRNYNCFYYNQYNSLLNGKLIKPMIIINCPCKDKNIIFSFLKTALSHELTHLYDDWNELSRNNNGINYNTKNQDTTKLLNNYYNEKDNILSKSFSFLSYMSLKVEKQAFLSQTVQELEEVGCTLYNYRTKLKETTMYKNIIKSYNNVFENIKVASEEELRNFNEYIILTVPKANIPKLNINQFNFEKYKEMLLQWSEKAKHSLMKNYASIVQYYLDELKEKENSMKSLYIY